MDLTSTLKRSELPLPLPMLRGPRGFDDTRAVHWHASPELSECAETLREHLEHPSGPRWESIEYMASWYCGMAPTVEGRMWGGALVAACRAEWRAVVDRADHPDSADFAEEYRHYFLVGVIPWLVRRIESGDTTESDCAAVEVRIRDEMQRDLAHHPDRRVRAMV